MWTTKNRGRYDRSQLRYPSDLTDDEWAGIEPLISPAKRGGNRRHVDVREVMNGMMYVLSTGCQWRAIPKDLPPRSTVFHYFDRPPRSAAIIDSQSVKSAEKGGPASIRMAMMRARRSRARSATFS